MNNLPEDRVAKRVPDGEREDLQEVATETAMELTEISRSMARAADSTRETSMAVNQVASDTRALAVVVGILTAMVALLILLIAIGSV